MGFGSDGAAVMTGRVTGVPTRLHHSNQYRVSIHYVAHPHLALTCSQAEDVDFVSKFKRTLLTLCWFFQASPVRTSGLKALHEMLKSLYLRLKEAKDDLWLSHDQAVQTLRRCLSITVHTSLLLLQIINSYLSVSFVLCYRYVSCILLNYR